MMEGLRRFIIVDNHEAAKDWRLGEDPGIALGGEAQNLLWASLKRWCAKQRMN